MLSSPIGVPTTAQTPVHRPMASTLGVKLTSGAVAGITGTLAIYPLDMVKTRLQNQRPSTLTGELPYRNGLDCVRQLIRVDGFRGLYRGLGPNLVGITPEKAIKLAVNDSMREYLARRRGTPNGVDGLSTLDGMLAGATAGFCQVVATNPMEIVKIRMQVQAGTAATSNTRRMTAIEVVRGLGLRGLYRGTPATLLRDVPFSVIFFPLQARLKLAFSPFGPHDPPPFYAIFLGGVVAGAVAGAAVTPADVVKTRLQAADRLTVGAKLTAQPLGVAAIFRDIWVNEGPKAFFKGAGWRAAIISPLFAIALLTYEIQQRYFIRQR